MPQYRAGRHPAISIELNSLAGDGMPDGIRLFVVSIRGWFVIRENLMKRSAIFFLIIILTACATPTSQVTVTSEVTVTLTPTPTQTPTPEPALPAEVVEKFNKAGINPSDLQNATVDQNGMHITIDGKAIDISLDDFKANTFNAVNSNAVRIIDTANKNGVFVINQAEDGKWVVEKQIFTPANDIEFSENLSKYDLSIAPDADRQAIYEDIAISHLGDATSKSEGMEFSRRVYEEIIKDHPEWEGIALGDDYEVRGDFMQEFLKRTGGLMVVTDMNWNKFEADLNKPVGFEVIEVDKRQNDFGKIQADETGQLIYSVLIPQLAIEETQGISTSPYGISIYFTWKWSPDGFVSDLFRRTISTHAYGTRDSDRHNYELYTRGGTPNSGRFYADVYWTFIK